MAHVRTKHLPLPCLAIVLALLLPGVAAALADSAPDGESVPAVAESAKRRAEPANVVIPSLLSALLALEDLSQSRVSASLMMPQTPDDGAAGRMVGRLARSLGVLLGVCLPLLFLSRATFLLLRAHRDAQHRCFLRRWLLLAAGGTLATAVGIAVGRRCWPVEWAILQVDVLATRGEDHHRGTPRLRDAPSQASAQQHLRSPVGQGHRGDVAGESFAEPASPVGQVDPRYVEGGVPAAEPPPATGRLEARRYELLRGFSRRAGKLELPLTSKPLATWRVLFWPDGTASMRPLSPAFFGPTMSRWFEEHLCVVCYSLPSPDALLQGHIVYFEGKASAIVTLTPPAPTDVRQFHAFARSQAGSWQWLKPSAAGTGAHIEMRALPPSGPGMTREIEALMRLGTKLLPEADAFVAYRAPRPERRSGYDGAVIGRTRYVLQQMPRQVVYPPRRYIVFRGNRGRAVQQAAQDASDTDEEFALPGFPADIALDRAVYRITAEYVASFPVHRSELASAARLEMHAEWRLEPGRNLNAPARVTIEVQALDGTWHAAGNVAYKPVEQMPREALIEEVSFYRGPQVHKAIPVSVTWKLAKPDRLLERGRQQLDLRISHTGDGPRLGLKSVDVIILLERSNP